jgi:hypothetical protein
MSKNGSLKEIKEVIMEGKKWIMIHPRSTFAYGFSLFIFFTFLFEFTIPLLKQSQLITDGKVINPLTYNQLTGLVLLLFAIVMLGIGYFAMRFITRLSNELVLVDEKKHSSPVPNKLSTEKKQ